MYGTYKGGARGKGALLIRHRRIKGAKTAFTQRLYIGMSVSPLSVVQKSALLIVLCRSPQSLKDHQIRYADFL